MSYESVLQRLTRLLRYLTHELGDFAFGLDSRHIRLSDDAGANAAIVHAESEYLSVSVPC